MSLFLLPIVFAASSGPSDGAHATEAVGMEHVRVAADKVSFVLGGSSKAFVPWGFNYDHDERGRLLEDYWDPEWDKVCEDFQEMKLLGANVVRIHLQFGKFMRDANTPNGATLDRLGRLLAMAERLGIHLDITGLGCYHKQDVPDWYDVLSEKDRWEVQARFWGAIARRCATSPAVFCYDLMNEPVVPAGRRPAGGWLGRPLEDKHFVQFISLDQGERDRPAIAQQWIRQLSAAIRQHDRRHLITVGLVPWSLNRPGLTSGFEPDRIASEVDFISVHLYPESGRVEESLKTLAGFSVGKPVLIEETFPLRCGMPDFKRFVDESAKIAAGWVGFYWGKTPEECRRSGTIPDAMMLGWLEYFQERARRENAPKMHSWEPSPTATRTTSK